jgi:hypothetical protein
MPRAVLLLSILLLPYFLSETLMAWSVVRSGAPLFALSVYLPYWSDLVLRR